MDHPRELALDVLIKVDKKEELSHIAVGNVLEKYQLAPKRDRAFFTRLVEGTLERQITIDYVIDQFSKTKVRKCKPLIRALLRMGVYQILYMDQVPDSAACNESVKLAKKRGFSRLSGFVNGVLRNISRKKEEIIWPNRAKNEIFYLSVKYSIPEWILRFFAKTYKMDVVEKMASSFIQNKETTLCCLKSRAKKEEIRKELEDEQVIVRDGQLMEKALKISNYDSLYRLKPFRDGKCMVQDESSMLAASLSGVKKDQIVLDLCSAPGGKAIYIADELCGSGKVIARDLTEYKTDLMEDNLERTKLTNMEVQISDARILDKQMIEKADVVIADLPCSGLGIMGRKNDIKYHMTEKSLKELASLQREILKCAVQYVKPGGILLYSTCTINPQENEKNYQWIIENFDYSPVDLTKELPKNLTIDTAKDGYIQLLPGVHPCDGFFVGKLRRKSR